MESRGIFEVVSGKLLVNGVEVVPGVGAGFYLSVKQSNDLQSFTDINVISFDSQDFYLEQNAANTDEVIIGFRGGAGNGAATAPGGNDTEIQYNNAGAFGGTTNLEWDAGNGRLLIPDGAVGTPGIAFKADPDVGIYRSGAGLLISTAGSLNTTFSGNNLTNVGSVTGARFVASNDGTKDAPALRGTDTKTGLFFEASGDYLSITSEGTHTWRFVSGNMTGQSSDSKIQCADGTTGSVAHTFFNDTNTGMNRLGTDRIAMITGGKYSAFFTRDKLQVRGGFYSTAFGEPLFGPGGSAAQVQFNQNGVLQGATKFEWDTANNKILIPIGSQSHPAIGFWDDQNTGLWRKGSDAIGFVAGGDNSFSIYRDGIATTGKISAGGGFYSNLLGEPVYGIVAGTNVTISEDALRRITINSTGGAGAVTFKETESGGYSKSDDTVAFDSKYFYLQSGGDGNPIVSTSCVRKARFVQSTAVTEWILAHNLDTSFVTWSAYDNRREAIIPYKVDVSDPNTTYFYFTATKAGFAVIIG